MRIIINERHAKLRRIKRIAAIIGITTLTLILSFSLLIVLIAVLFPRIAESPILIVLMGLTSGIIGLQAGSQLANSPAPHDELNAALKGLGNDTTIYHYWLPSAHVLVTPNGIFTLTVRSQDARVTFKPHQIHTADSLGKRIKRTLSFDTVGNPIKEATKSTYKLNTWLGAHQTTHGLQAYPLIVFTNPAATVIAPDNMEPPVLFSDRRKPSLKTFIRKYSGPPIPSDTTAQIEAILDIPK